MHREPPLADQGGARWSVWNFVRWRALDGKTLKLLRGYVSTHHDVADNAHAQTIDFRDLAGQHLCLRGSPDPDHSADERCDETRAPGTQEVSSRQGSRSGHAIAGAKEHINLLVFASRIGHGARQALAKPAHADLGHAAAAHHTSGAKA